MKQILFTFFFLAFSLVSRTSLAQMDITKGYVKLGDGVSRYVEFQKPKPGKPWIVFVNGLVYDIDRWKEMDAPLQKEGYGILHYYFRGQDWTLAREADEFKTPLFFKDGLSSIDFADELSEIIAAFEIKEKVIVVGLSYGSHIAANFAETYPEMVDKVVFLAPLVVPLERYEPQGVWLDWNLAWVRAMWGNYFYEYAYRQIYSTYLDARVSNNRVPSHLSEIPDIYKESLFHLVRATRDFDLKRHDFAELGKKSVFFMLAQEEQPQAFEDQVKAFEGISAQAQGSLIWFPESAHAIPDSEGRRAALYLNHIIQNDPRLKQGQRYKSTSQGLTNW